MKKINNKGITLIALIITIILTLILTGITIEVSTSQIEKAKLEDLVTTMLLIKGRAQIAIDKKEFDETFDETGMLTYANATEYTSNIPSNLASKLTDKSNLYIWEQTAMDNNNIDVEINSEEFFIIDYNTKEIYFSQGFEYNGNMYYSLTELQEL